MKHLVALSGGKDSTALALRLAEVEPRDYIYFCSPTGDELPEMEEHWSCLENLLGHRIIRLKHPEYPTLNSLIEHFNALPNWRMRWCTRILKIEVAQQFYKENDPAVVYVGLRADEEERKGGIYGDIVEQRYPLREWGWGLQDVLKYLIRKRVSIPRRTDCARCFFQRLGQWWDLWKIYPEIYAHAEAQEKRTNHTFRAESKDDWPGALKELRGEFERGRMPRGTSIQRELIMDYHDCRACSL